MEHLIRSLRVLWRSERILAEYQFKQGTQRIQLNALAGLVAVFGLVMLSIAAFTAILSATIAMVDAELVSLKDGIYKFMSNPVESLIPGAIGPLLNAVVKGLGSAKK